MLQTFLVSQRPVPPTKSYSNLRSEHLIDRKHAPRSTSNVIPKPVYIFIHIYLYLTPVSKNSLPGITKTEVSFIPVLACSYPLILCFPFPLMYSVLQFHLRPSSCIHRIYHSHIHFKPLTFCQSFYMHPYHLMMLHLITSTTQNFIASP